MSPSDQPSFEVFYDGDCPLCSKEISLLKKLDRSGRLKCTDIAQPSFDALGETRKSSDALMAEIHGRLENGQMVIGVEVFRQLYLRTFFHFLVPISRLWGLRNILDLAYTFFAKHRLKLTGRCNDKGCVVSTPS